MPGDKKPNNASEQPSDAAIASMANEVALLGAEEGSIVELLAKGLNDASNNMADIAKRALAMNKAQMDDEGEGDEGDEGEGDEGDEGEAPGYEDLNLAEPTGHGSVAAAIGNNGADVTNFVLDASARIVRLEKAQLRQFQLMEQMAKENRRLTRELAKMVEASTQATTSIVAPLAKAVAEQRSLIEQIPAPGITPARFNQPKPRPVDAALIGGDPRVEKQALMKARNDSILTAEQYANFRTGRRFHTDEAENTRIRGLVESLANGFKPGAPASA